MAIRASPEQKFSMCCKRMDSAIPSHALYAVMMQLHAYHAVCAPC
jgi:hypothetical protein